MGFDPYLGLSKSCCLGSAVSAVSFLHGSLLSTAYAVLMPTVPRKRASAAALQNFLAHESLDARRFSDSYDL